MMRVKNLLADYGLVHHTFEEAKVSGMMVIILVMWMYTVLGML